MLAMSLHVAYGANPVCHLKESEFLLFFCEFECVVNYVASVAYKKEDNKKHNCWTIYGKSPSGLMEIFMFKMYSSSFAICIIFHRFYGKLSLY